MRTIDTNVVVRLLTADDPAQHRRALQAVSQSPVLILNTVLLETAWVLGSSYGFSDREIAGALRRLAGGPTIHFEDADSVFQALEYARQGMDIGDAFHLALTPKGATFVSLDKPLARLARKLGAGPVEEP